VFPGFIPGLLAGQAVVQGIVLNDSTSVALPGTIIEIPKLALSTTADARGLFSFASVPLGKHGVLARAIGYQPRTLSILIAQPDTVRLVFRLRQAPVRLAPIEVEEQTATAINPRMAGFADRRRMGQGEFLGPAELEQLAHTSLPEVLRQFGLTIRTGRGRTYAIGRRGGTCPVEVFLDGILQSRRPEPFDLSSISVEALAGIEYYVGGARLPVLFTRGDSSCGVLVLWTRMRRP
jgi:hypothetical protein